MAHIAYCYISLPIVLLGLRMSHNNIQKIFPHSQSLVAICLFLILLFPLITLSLLLTVLLNSYLMKCILFTLISSPLVIAIQFLLHMCQKISFHGPKSVLIDRIIPSFIKSIRPLKQQGRYISSDIIQPYSAGFKLLDGFYEVTSRHIVAIRSMIIPDVQSVCDYMEEVMNHSFSLLHLSFPLSSYRTMLSRN